MNYFFVEWIWCGIIVNCINNYIIVDVLDLKVCGYKIYGGE